MNHTRPRMGCFRSKYFRAESVLKHSLDRISAEWLFIKIHLVSSEMRAPHCHRESRSRIYRSKQVYDSYEFRWFMRDIRTSKDIVPSVIRKAIFHISFFRSTGLFSPGLQTFNIDSQSFYEICFHLLARFYQKTFDKVHWGVLDTGLKYFSLSLSIYLSLSLFLVFLRTKFFSLFPTNEL